ncbi:hypothetical protein BDV95DRAFT_91232 [Massariosphaeria phaeospora]|uniref:Uncharacterized protein n=1 Tax=Massariosphaeria phaeospora TaxID=100035 RepID=A0A7C8M7I2_9PLEO|nr:hypothetical protein BDV95DRAFT_91232 [Massariosphaeria phaeospora]
MAMGASSAAASATPTSQCGTTPYTQFPSSDVLCAVGGTSGVPSNYSDILKDCCKDAPVESFANDCALYCLAIGQSVADLQLCWQNGGVNPAMIFCNGTQKATATTRPEDVKATAPGSTGRPGESKGAAAVVVVPQGVSKAGLGLLAVLVVSMAAGVLV